MESSTKKTLCIISALFNIVTGSLYALYTLYILLSYAFQDIYYLYLNYYYSYATYVSILIIDIVFGALIVLFSSISLFEKYRYKLPLSITLLVFFGLWSISAIISRDWLGAVLSFIAIWLKIAAMAVKDTNAGKPNSQAEQVPVNNSLETKIEELKHFKELGIISEEQYEEAVKKAVSSIL